MKRLWIAFSLLAACSASFAQEKILLTRKGEWTTDAEKAVSYALVYPKAKKLIKVEEFTLDGRKISVSHYSKYKEDRRERVKQGLHTTLYANGQDSLVVNYEDNRKKGESHVYFPNGKVAIIQHYQDNRLNGPFIQYYENGAVKREEAYENDRCTGGKLYSQQGEELEQQAYQIFPAFPGGMAALMQLLAKEVKYPLSAQKQKIEGKVVVQFVVNKEGKMVDPKIVKNVYHDIDAEAWRAFNVIAETHRWSPGYIDGEAKKVKFNVPITFRLTR